MRPRENTTFRLCLMQLCALLWQHCQFRRPLTHLQSRFYLFPSLVVDSFSNPALTKGTRFPLLTQPPRIFL